jgi:hypothetical protein
LCCFKVDTGLGPVDFVFRPIPFDPHVYLQYSPYDGVGSRGPPCQPLSISDSSTYADRGSLLRLARCPEAPTACKRHRKPV